MVSTMVVNVTRCLWWSSRDRSDRGGQSGGGDRRRLRGVRKAIPQAASMDALLQPSVPTARMEAGAPAPAPGLERRPALLPVVLDSHEAPALARQRASLLLA